VRYIQKRNEKMANLYTVSSWLTAKILFLPITISYDVSFSIFEDNVVHDINAGYCIHDKDDGWFNTIRNNVCYNMNGYGISLSNQYTQGQIEVNHNLVIGNANSSIGINIGMQPGYIQNIFIHHNTLINSQIGFGGPIYDAKSLNYVIKNNIFSNDPTLPFYSADGSYDTSATGKTADQMYITAITVAKKASFDKNLYWGSSSSQKIISWAWGSNGDAMSAWKSLGFDLNSIFFVKPSLSTDGSYSLPESDVNFGVYGKDIDPGGWQ
jgi:hypothetical protein